MAVKKKKGPKKNRVEMTLWNVLLSFPKLHDPKPYKGKTYYQTDVLMDADDPQLGALRKAIKNVKRKSFGTDESEWPTPKKPLIRNGDNRKDQKGYAGKRFVPVSTQQPVPVVDLKGKAFPAQSVKGGMFGNVAVCISNWENEGDEGVSIYLQGVQIDTKTTPLNFGGGKSVKAMFKKDGEDGDDDDSDDSDSNEDSGDEEEDEKPKKKKKRPVDEDEDEEDSDDEDESNSDGDDESESDDDDADDEDEEDEKPKKKAKKKKRPVDEDEDEDESED